MEHTPAIGLGRDALTRWIEVAVLELHNPQELSTLQMCATFHVNGVRRGELSRGDEVAAFLVGRILHLSDPTFQCFLEALTAQVISARIMLNLNPVTIANSVEIQDQLSRARMPLDIPRFAGEETRGATSFHWIIPWVRHPDREAIFRGDFSVLGFRAVDCQDGAALADGLIRAAAWFSAADLSDLNRGNQAAERWCSFLAAWHEWRRGTESMRLEPRREHDSENARAVMAFYAEFSVEQLLKLRETLPDMTRRLGQALVRIPLETVSDRRRYLRGVVVHWRQQALARYSRLEDLFGSDSASLSRSERYLVWLLATQTDVHPPELPYNRLIRAHKAYQLTQPEVPTEEEIHAVVAELSAWCEI